MGTRDTIDRTLENEELPVPDKDDDARKLTGPGLKYALKRAVKKFSLDAGTDLSAILTYYMVLSLAPALLAIFSILSLVLASNADSVRTMIDDVVTDAVPVDYQPLVLNLVETMMDSTAGGIIALIIGIATALWSASGYVKAFSRNMNTIYGVAEGRGFVAQTLTMLAVTLTMLVGVVVVLVSLALNRTLVDSLFAPLVEPLGLQSTLNTLTDSFLPVWEWMKYPVVLLIVIGLIAVLYHFTPNVQRPRFRWLSIGAIFALVGIALAGIAMIIYLTYFAGYSAYGMIGTIMALLFVLWVFNIVLLMGAELDVEIERARELQTGLPAEEDLQLPPRGVAKVEKLKEGDDEIVAEGRNLRRALHDPDASDD
ncbi:MAG: YihY/virulence factor BrkB family protein [Micrococcaceae bacterium]